MRQVHLHFMLAVAGVFAATLLGSAPADARQAGAEKAVLQAMGDALTTADFIRVTGHGRLYGKADWLKSSGAPGPERPRETPQEVTVRIYGDGAVLTYRNTPTMFDGRRGPVSYFAGVFEKQGAQWKLALTQSTGVDVPLKVLAKMAGGWQQVLQQTPRSSRPSRKQLFARNAG